MATTTPLFTGVLGLGGPELIIILVILLVLFGGSKLPGLAKGIGQSIKEFKKAAKEEEASDAKPTVTPAPAPVEAKKPEPAKTHGSN
jgi:sec-independent protein translocase protein TatA